MGILGKYEDRPQDAAWFLDVAADVFLALCAAAGVWLVVVAVFSLVAP